MTENTICDFCGDAFAPLLVSPCGGCSRATCFQCEKFKIPGGGHTFCGDCAYPCAVDGCDETIWPESVFKRASDAGRVACVRCGKHAANTCAAHNNKEAPRQCVGGAKPCLNFVCHECRYFDDQEHRSCADHVRGCSGCQEPTEWKNMYWCAAEECGESFCKRLRTTARVTHNSSGHHNVDDLTEECYQTHMKRDSVTAQWKCTRHLEYCSMCKRNSEPVSKLHRSLMREHHRLCVECFGTVGARINVYEANLSADQRTRFPDDLKRLMASFLVKAERKEKDAREAGWAAPARRSPPKKARID